MPLTLSAQSTMYLRVPLYNTVNGVRVDPTGDDVFMAVVRRDVPPTDDDWFAGSWETDSASPGGPIYYARGLVGPGGEVTLEDGKSYNVWIKLIDTPEEPVLLGGELYVTDA